ncbi:MAG: helix-turn-helix domain-containing protein [Acidobacteria bacterium]|nr:helix-turn-helix domain-containing protein [Acidobacteriota bacterium]MBI3662161.1 helix-turn-helix domain-containing protein [Acidobacteriota bacterium]
MSFVGLQDNLRRELRKRIEGGELTGMELARRTGFTQAHISNFLNKKRGLKLSALDKMVRAIGLSLYDLLNPHEVAKVAAVPPGKDEEYADVPLVEGVIAAGSEVIVNEEVKELLKFRRSFLNRVRADLAAPATAGRTATAGRRKEWTRFVLIKVDQKEGLSMWPRVGPGATLLIDRHYNSLRQYRKNDRNMYAVRKNDGCTVKYVELREGGKEGAGVNPALLVLRPHNQDYPVEVLPIEEGQTYADLIVGRVAHVAVET